MDFDNISQPESIIFEKNQENFVSFDSLENFFKTNSKDGVLFIRKSNFESLLKCNISKHPFCSAGIVISSQSGGKRKSNVYGLCFDEYKTLSQTEINCETLFKNFPVCSIFFKVFRDSFQLPNSSLIREVMSEFFEKKLVIVPSTFDEIFENSKQFSSSLSANNFSDKDEEITSIQFIDLFFSQIFGKEKIYCFGGIDQTFEKEQRKDKFFSSADPQNFISSLFLDLYQVCSSKNNKSALLLQSYFAPNDVLENQINCFSQTISQKDKINVEKEKQVCKDFFNCFVDNLFSQNKDSKEIIVGGFNLGVANSILKKTSFVKTLLRVKTILLNLSQNSDNKEMSNKILFEISQLSKIEHFLQSNQN